MIDLRSDTVTRPTPGMMEAIMNARVGDDVLGDDPTVIKLQDKAAALFGMDAALFCPSGTMTNQIAINVHTQPGDEVICHKSSHVYYYEGGAMMSNSGVSVCLLDGKRGLVNPDEIVPNINPDNIHRPITRLVSLENTTNKGGGACYNFEDVRKISSICKEHGLKLHLDGARIFNALAGSNEFPWDYGSIVDSVSVCLSKGLGAPIGSLLIGDKDFINHGKRKRKAFGGAMRQAGYLAAAGIYALDNHVLRLKDDHDHAKMIAKVLDELPWVESVLPVETNILIFNLPAHITGEEIVRKLASEDIHVLAIGPHQIRMVTHLDIEAEMVETVKKTLVSLG